MCTVQGKDWNGQIKLGNPSFYGAWGSCAVGLDGSANARLHNLTCLRSDHTGKGWCLNTSRDNTDASYVAVTLLGFAVCDAVCLLMLLLLSKVWYSNYQ